MAEDNKIDFLLELIKNDKAKLESEDFQGIQLDYFNLTGFWHKFEAAVLSLSNDVSKMCFLCGNRPIPKEADINRFVQGILSYYKTMQDLYHMLPQGLGFVFFKAITTALLNITTSLFDVVQSCKILTVKGAEDRLKLVGTFWDYCNKVPLLPKNNVQATLNLIDDEGSLASYALVQLKTTIANDLVEEINEEWTSTEQELASLSVCLVKATQTCILQLRKAVASHGSCSTNQHCGELDITTEAVGSVSPALDDFVSELYHTMDVPLVMENAGKLVKALQDMLGTVKATHFEKGINIDAMNKMLLHQAQSLQSGFQSATGCPISIFKP